MADKEDNMIFDFTWGDTYGFFSEGYHVMIKDASDLYLTWSVDLKYGEVKLDNAKLEEFIKDLKGLHIDSWNGRTYSNSDFENADTWKLTVNNIVLIMESKGANDYPPEWNEFLEYLHEKWQIPKSTRELPPEERKKLLKLKEEKERKAEEKHDNKDKQKDNKPRKKNNDNRKDRNDRKEGGNGGGNKEGGDKPKNQGRKNNYRKYYRKKSGSNSGQHGNSES